MKQQIINSNLGNVVNIAYGIVSNSHGISNAPGARIIMDNGNDFLIAAVPEGRFTCDVHYGKFTPCDPMNGNFLSVTDWCDGERNRLCDRPDWQIVIDDVEVINQINHGSQS